MRGTALEYLETVLPRELTPAFLRLVGASPMGAPRPNNVPVAERLRRFALRRRG
jgi:hypothetical protein